MSPEAASVFEAAFRAHIDGLNSATDASKLIAEKRRATLEADSLRVVDAIVKIGHSDALQTRLQSIETELAELKASDAAAPKPHNPDIKGQFKRALLGLQEALESDTSRARIQLEALLGDIAIEIRGEDEIWAHLKTHRLLQLAVGESIKVVAGTGFEPVTFGL